MRFPSSRTIAVVGMVTFDAIARRINLPLTTKIEHLMLLPPIVGTTTAYPELSEQLLATGMRAAPVTGAKGVLLGVVSRTDLVRALPKIPVLADHRVDEVMAPLNLLLQERDPARTLLGQEALRHLETHPLPVIDRKGALSGAVGIADLGEVLWRPTAQGHRDVANRGNVADVEVRTIMHSPAVTVPRGTTTGAAARLMTQERVSSVFIVEGGRPAGIVSQADLIGLAVGGSAPREGELGDVFVQIQGLRASGDPAILADIDQVIAKGLRRIARHVRPVMLNVHFSPHASHRSGEASVEGRLNTDHEILYAVAQPVGTSTVPSTTCSTNSRHRLAGRRKNDPTAPTGAPHGWWPRSWRRTLPTRSSRSASGRRPVELVDGDAEGMGGRSRP